MLRANKSLRISNQISCKFHFCILLVFLILPFNSFGQNISDDARIKSALHLLDVWLDAQLAYEQIPGISIGIVHDQKLIWSRGYGYADKENKIPAAPNTIYSICSISKLFTSIAVMQLYEQGLLRLDDPVAKHLSWFKIKQVHKNSPPITIESLLTHSGGLPREADTPYWTEASFPSREVMIEKLTKQETLYPARTYFQYSNLGLSLAGEVVASVSGKSYSDFIQQTILTPLGLNDTSSDIPLDKKGKQLATGYSSIRRDGKRKPVPSYTVNGIAPAAGFASTVEDLGKFASWQFRLLESNNKEILEANTLRKMHRVHWLDPEWDTKWGLGFSVWRHNDKTFVGHGGSCPGYRTQLLLQTKDKIATIFMTNAQGVSTRMYAEKAYDIIAPAIADVIKSPDKREQINPEFLKYIGKYERPLGGETDVLIWNGKLAMLSLPTENPLNSLTKLKHIDGNTFKRIRDDGELGEEVVFEADANGRIIKFWKFSNYMNKVR